MPLNEEQNRKVLPAGWSAEEELMIGTIQQTESVSRPEAIRRVRRRKKLSPLATGVKSLNREAVLVTGRMCRNLRCTRGEDHGPGSLAHLRADARYCIATCKKAAQRSRKRKNRTSNRQYSCRFKGGQILPLLPPPFQPDRGAQIVRNRIVNSSDELIERDRHMNIGDEIPGVYAGLKGVRS